jgi:hypothetical protein
MRYKHQYRFAYESLYGIKSKIHTSKTYLMNVSLVRVRVSNSSIHLDILLIIRLSTTMKVHKPQHDN